MAVESKMPDAETSAGSLKALLSGIVDYAGLFPPAALDMASTVKNYARYLHGADAWMLGRLIVPAGKLNEFEAAATGLLPTDPTAEPWRLSGLVAAADDSGLQAGIDRIILFNRTHANPAGGMASITAIELGGAEPDAIEGALDLIPDELFPFFELPIDGDPRGLVAAISGSDAGAKVRTGGLKPEAIPTPEDLARFIAACAAGDVPFKATAGLHHPLRHRCESVGADEFGFLNVFAAAVLAHGGDRDEAKLAEVLAEQSIDAFEFTADTLTWRDSAIGTDVIDETRRCFAISYGSCSFEEPLDDLRSLKLL
jgi:hypothetical protein